MNERLKALHERIEHFPEPVWVCCADCQHFEPPPRAMDPNGVGTCRKGVSAKTGHPPYPRVKRVCESYRALGGPATPEESVANSPEDLGHGIGYQGKKREQRKHAKQAVQNLKAVLGHGRVR